MSKELLDLLKIEKINLDGHEYYILQLNLKIMSPVSSIPSELEKEEVLQFIEDEMKYTYIRRILELMFKYLFSKKLKGLKFMDCDIVITPEIEESCIVIHPNTFAKLLKEEKTKGLWKVEKK